MAVYKIKLPLRVPLGKKKIKYFSLNMNQYRNTHFYMLNDAKIVFKEMIAPFLGSVPYITEPCKLIYVLYPKTDHLQDVGNICSIADKFFCDAMTELGKWEDDNYEIINEVTYKFGKVDKTDPRIEVYICTHEDDMKISLIEKEIKEAIENYLSQSISLPEGKKYSVDLVATRGSDGITANVEIVAKAEEVKAPVAEDPEPVVSSEPAQTEKPKLFGNMKTPF